MSSPEPMHNRITNVEDNFRLPVFCQTFCCAFVFSVRRQRTLINFIPFFLLVYDILLSTKQEQKKKQIRILVQ